MNRTNDDLRAAVKERFAAVAPSPGQEKKFPVGPDSASKIGYDPREIDALPPAVTESLCGVGNPLGLGAVHPGQTVMDRGSGAGTHRPLGKPAPKLESVVPQWASSTGPA